MTKNSFSGRIKEGLSRLIETNDNGIITEKQFRRVVGESVISPPVTDSHYDIARRVLFLLGYRQGKGVYAPIGILRR